MLRSALPLLLLILICSCNDAIVFSEYRTTNDGKWDKSNTMEFTFSDMDTLQQHNLFINIRNDNGFPYSNLFLITELEYPNGKVERDTLEYEMAAPDGSWLGKNSGSVSENKLWYKENIVLPFRGVYKVGISHAMRKNGSVEGVVNLEGVTDVGFQIEKSK